MFSGVSESDDDFRVNPSQLAMEPVDTLCNSTVAVYDQSKSKVINDPVHGHFRIRGECVRVIDTPEFQRLRDIKQLGTSYYVFPGAGHNRFEHSLGVCHMAEEMVIRIQRAQRDLGIDNQDVKRIALAGLCHDLGHAPFSHVFDNEFLPKVLGENFESFDWSHEKMSGRLLEQIIDTQYIDDDCISREDCRKIEDLIRSSCSDYKIQYFKENHYLREIVANGRNSIDVDKFDYLARDCYYCGVQASCDFKRVMPFVRVIDDTICFKASEIWNIYEIFHTRASLHRRVYTHKVAKAIEYMIVDAMVEANNEFEILKKCQSPKTFIELDDSILKRIEFADPADDNAGLRKAKSIVDRIRRRKLYKYVNEYCVPTERLPNWQKVKAEDVVGCQLKNQAHGVELKPDDIVIQNLKIDWAMKDKNPVDHVYFFQNARSSEKFHIPKEKVSTLLPEVFQERKVRLFVKDQEKFDAASIAFEEYQRRFYGVSQQVASTPPRNIPAPRSTSQVGSSRARKSLMMGTVAAANQNGGKKRKTSQITLGGIRE
ncbi:deoxynucleoside triphosphate triphosphohydrolase [Chloropicon roscoffensis]|uniref:Deoxynucleoside triphosphate triphosphohydrolase n=1 Tax=Chloropicon roscoffensis TaxID=1461544 RepID=A0AAX4PCB7_9CHLO